MKKKQVKKSVKKQKPQKKVTFTAMKKESKQKPVTKRKDDGKLKIDMPFEKAIKKAFSPSKKSNPRKGSK